MRIALAASIALCVACIGCGPAEPPGPVLLRNADGLFVSAEPAAGAWYAGEGVAALLPLGGQTDGELLAGRLDPAARAALLWTVGRDGAFEARQATLRDTDRSLRVAVGEALVRAFATPPPGRTTARFATQFTVPPASRSATEPRGPGEDQDRPIVGPARAPLPAGTPFDEWASPGEVFVRCRSVEAAYRFAGLADDLTNRLFAAAGEGRDHAALRLALHGLLLPSIWRTNPDAEKGVGEVCLLLDPALRRGGPGVAVLLRITDPELHRMQTTSGLAYEARPGHAWEPADDPFPALRPTRNRRRVLGDVELVGTHRPPYARLLRGDRPPLHGIADYRAARAACDAVRERPPAVFAWFPPDGAWSREAWTSAEDRESEGLAALAAAWIGPLPRAAPAASEASPAAPAALMRLHWLRIDTDARGAAVVLAARDEETARDVAAALSAPSPSATRLAGVCRRNQEDLLPLGLIEPRATEPAERCLVWLGWRPLCPCGGTYRFHPLTGAASCTAHGSLTAPREAPPGPSPLASDVSRKGLLLTLRLRIAWGRKE